MINDPNYIERIALVNSQGKTITFGELDVSLNHFTSLLLKFQIGGGCRVAILLEKSFASVIAIYSCADISAAYIPIDIQLPQTRISQIISDCSPHVIVHNQPALFPENESHPCNVAGMEGSFITPLLTPNYSEVEKKDAQPNFFEERISHILYTSGSTGIPKGVVVPYNAANSFVQWARNTFRLNQSDNIASIAPFYFDLSLLDLFVARNMKATLHLFSSEQVQNPRQMSEELAKRKITSIYATPTFYSSLQEFGKIEKQDWSPLRTVLFAGEVFPVKHLHALMSVWSKAVFYNLYGPTETNVCTFAEIHRDENRIEPYPIGQPCVDHEIQITEQGELLVGGPHVAKGYLNRSELNEAKFFTVGNTRWFRTGDRVEVDQSGMLIYKGRMDRMVKRRGYRIEPGEIEVALHTISGITGAAVVEHSVNDLVLLKAIVTTDGSRSFNIVEIKAQLIQVIPDYMLPDSVVTIKEFPKTSSGKIDYLKLREEVVSSLQK